MCFPRKSRHDEGDVARLELRMETFILLDCHAWCFVEVGQFKQRFLNDRITQRQRLQTQKCASSRACMLRCVNVLVCGVRVFKDIFVKAALHLLKVSAV